MHGIVTTYQQVASTPGAIAHLARGAFVIFDEIHHGGEQQAWGSALQEAFAAAARTTSEPAQ